MKDGSHSQPSMFRKMLYILHDYKAPGHSLFRLRKKFSTYTKGTIVLLYLFTVATIWLENNCTLCTKHVTIISQQNILHHYDISK